MKLIKMSDLKLGDIFAHEIKLHGRKAFLVDSIHEKTIVCKDRITGKSVSKEKKGEVYLLRNVYE